LLAGLFGSAFVPAARAAADNAATITCAADGDVAYQTAASGIVYAPAGATVSCVVTADRETDGLMTLTATGGHTIVSVPSVDASVGAAAAHASSAAVIWTINAAGTSASANVDHIADDNEDETADDVIFTVNVKIGSAVGFLNVFKGTSLGTELADIQFTPSSDEAAVPSGNYSQVSEPCAPITMEVDGDIEVSAANKVVADEEVTDINAANTANLPLNALVAAGGTYCTSSTGIPAVAAGGVYFMQVKAYDAYGVAVPTTANVKIAATLSAGSPAGVEVLDVPTSLTGSVDDDLSDSLAETDGLDYVVITGDGDAGRTTVTVTVGSLTYTRTVIFLGDVDSITLSGPTHMATVGAERAAFFDALGVVCKDEAGTVIGDGGGLATSYTDGDLGACIDTAISFEVLDGALNVTSTYSDDSSNSAATETTQAYEFNDEHIFIDSVAPGAGTGTFSDLVDDFSVAQDGNWSIPWELCQDGDEGETRKITAKVGIEASNQVTITCVENKVKITSLTALATGTSGSATSGANGQTIKVSVAATDGYGRPAGSGSSFTFTTTATGGSTSTSTASFGGGSATLTITLGTTSGAQYVLYSATDGDQVTTGAQAFAQKISFTVTNSADSLSDYVLTKSGAKVTGSNFSARATVKVEVENASKGTVKVYTRKANAAGKVVYTIAGRGTFYVTMYTGAAGAEVLSNTVTVRR
jgi:hypothetical protein